MPIRHEITPEELGRSMRWFPLVGIAIACIAGFVDLILTPLVAAPVRTILVIVVLIAITGALHLDGLMDTCDAIFAFTSPERRLEIMRDSRVGSFAIVGAATLLLMKYAAILSLPPDRHLAAFIAMGAISRWAMVFSMVRYPVARQSGLGYEFKKAVGRKELAIATATAVLAALVAGLAGIAVFILALIATMAMARYTMSKIPGLTGDIYGAISEGTETLVALALPPLWRLL